MSLLFPFYSPPPHRPLFFFFFLLFRRPPSSPLFPSTPLSRNRLRYVLQDELFVRGPDGMQPTERAAEIAPRLRQGLLQLQLALAPADFVPERSDRRFTITCTEYGGAAVKPAFVPRLPEEGPP